RSPQTRSRNLWPCGGAGGCTIGSVKLAIIGGGGFRVPRLYHALLADRGTPRVTEVALYDPSAERLGVVRSVLAQQARGMPGAPRVSSPSDLAGALDGARFVFS